MGQMTKSMHLHANQFGHVHEGCLIGTSRRLTPIRQYSNTIIWVHVFFIHKNTYLYEATICITSQKTWGQTNTWPRTVASYEYGSHFE